MDYSKYLTLVFISGKIFIHSPHFLIRRFCLLSRFFSPPFTRPHSDYVSVNNILIVCLTLFFCLGGHLLWLKEVEDSEKKPPFFQLHQYFIMKRLVFECRSKSFLLLLFLHLLFRFFPSAFHSQQNTFHELNVRKMFWMNFVFRHVGYICSISIQSIRVFNVARSIDRLTMFRRISE